MARTVNPTKVEVRQKARALGHQLGCFEPAGFVGNLVAQCKLCRRFIYIQWDRVLGRRTIKGLDEPCPNNMVVRWSGGRQNWGKTAGTV